MLALAFICRFTGKSEIIYHFDEKTVFIFDISVNLDQNMVKSE